jgi:hypothetical protein
MDRLLAGLDLEVSFIKSPYGPGLPLVRRSAPCTRPRSRGARPPASAWNAEPTTTPAGREIGSTDHRLSAIGIYAADAQVYR